MRAELPFPTTTDADKWADAFLEAFQGYTVGGGIVSKGNLIDWFANAIEHGRGPEPITSTPVEFDPCPKCRWKSISVISYWGLDTFRAVCDRCSHNWFADLEGRVILVAVDI